MEILEKTEGDASIVRFLSSLVGDEEEVPVPSKQSFAALKSRPACEYHNYHKLGVSLCFEASTLQALHVYNGTHGYSRFSGQLPHDLRLEMKGREIVKLLGEPDGKMGGGRGGGAISIAYRDKGLQINFLGGDWEDRENVFDSITIHKPE